MKGNIIDEYLQIKMMMMMMIVMIVVVVAVVLMMICYLDIFAFVDFKMD